MFETKKYIFFKSCTITLHLNVKEFSKSVASFTWAHLSNLYIFNGRLRVQKYLNECQSRAMINDVRSSIWSDVPPLVHF